MVIGNEAVQGLEKGSEEDQPMTERMKMRLGQSFNSLDIELRLLREKARIACGKYNAHPSKGNFKHISRLFNRLSTAVIEPGFQCDYGGQISLGDNFYANFNCVMLDSAAITIGDDVMLGPDVHIYTVDHPRAANARKAGGCIAKPVIIADGVWIGGGAKILPGVTIGENAIIGANVVVTKDVAADSRFFG
jgi:maltose O-acetyltransferase